MKAKQTYSAEFKEQALSKVFHRGSRTVGSVADELNMNVMTLKNWMKGAVASTRGDGAGHAKRPRTGRWKNACWLCSRAMGWPTMH